MHQLANKDNGRKEAHKPFNRLLERYYEKAEKCYFEVTDFILPEKAVQITHVGLILLGSNRFLT